MKTTTASAKKEFRGKTKEELEKLLAEFRNRLRELRFKLARKEIKNVREISQTRRDIARILTILTTSYEKKE